jgi:hypothetical protein
MAEDDELMNNYRKTLLEGEKEVNEGFDKIIITLSGGALGISVAIIKDVVACPIQIKHILLLAWSSWGISLAAILVAFYCSGFAFKKAIKQVDSKAICNERPGGIFSSITLILNAIGALTFLLGSSAFIFFLYKNLGV